jgi:PAS domain S-box-containing protein
MRVEALARAMSPGLIGESPHFRILVDSLPAAIYTTDADGKITYFNEAAATFWGHRPEIGHDAWCGSWKLFWPDGTPLPHDQCPMAIALKERRAVRGVEAIAERPDGTRVPFMPYPTPMFDSDGTLIGAVNMLVDISAHKASEAALQADIAQRRLVEEALAERAHEQAALYRFTDSLQRAATLKDTYDAALDAILSALRCDRASILMFDQAGMMRFAAWRNLSDGYRWAVEGHSPWTPDSRDPEPVCIDDLETADIPESLKVTVRSEGIAALAFIPLVSKGRLIGKFMAYHSKPHKFTASDVDLAVTLARQLGFGIGRLNAERARYRAEEETRRLAAIVESSDDAIVSKDLNSIITSWNYGAERLFGYKAAEVQGKHISVLFPADKVSEEADILARIRRGERIEQYETVRRRKDGTLFDVSLTVSPVKDESGRIVGAAKIARDITDRKRAEAQRELLVAELSHRVKNTLATVISIQQQSFSKAPSMEEARHSFSARIRALAQTHGRLAEGAWAGVALNTLLQDELAPYSGDDGNNIRIDGPAVTLTPKSALTLGMAIHELATNAAKYGALSVKNGLVAVTWAMENGVLNIQWTERGGPRVTPPSRSGFGRVLLERALASDLQGEVTLDFAPQGLTCLIALPLHNHTAGVI